MADWRGDCYRTWYHTIMRGIPMDPVLSRTSIRSYTPLSVSQGAIINLLRGAMAAHSAGDQRPWHFVIIQDQAVRNRIADIDPFAHMVPQAPLAILVCGDPTLQVHQGLWVQDCAAATENILIEARLLGLGTVWLAIYPAEGKVQSLRRLLALPEYVIPFALVPVGYPAERREPAHRYDDLRVHYDCWGSNGRQKSLQPAHA
jgi:nitroreductase